MTQASGQVTITDPTRPIPLDRGRSGHADGVGLLVALTSAGAFGLAGSLGSGLIGAGWSPAATVTARAALSALVLLGPGLWLVRRRLGVLLTQARAILVYGGVAVAGAQLCYMNAVARIPVGIALLVEYLAPVLLVGWAWARHGRAPSRATALGTAVAVGGLLLVIDVVGGTQLDPIGLLWALGASVGLAVYFVASADERADLPPLTLAATGMGTAALILALAGAAGVVPMVATTQPVTLLGAAWPAMVVVATLALLPGAVAYVSGIAAARRLGSTVASFVGLTEVLFAVGFAWLLLGQAMGLQQLVGALVLLTGVALVRAGERPARPFSKETPHAHRG